VFKETPAKELTKANRRARLSCSKQLFSDKKLFTLATGTPTIYIMTVTDGE